MSRDNIRGLSCTLSCDRIFGALFSEMECAGQRKISSFFTREPAKRVQSTDDFSSPAAKHSRLESEHNNMSLTPEQKQRLDQKRSEARRLLIQKKVPQGVGPSWEKILNAEFQKPYFSQVGVTLFCMYS